MSLELFLEKNNQPVKITLHNEDGTTIQHDSIAILSNSTYTFIKSIHDDEMRTGTVVQKGSNLAEIIIGDKTTEHVSRKHGRLINKDGNLAYRDHSTNGTLVINFYENKKETPEVGEAIFTTTDGREVKQYRYKVVFNHELPMSAEKCRQNVYLPYKLIREGEPVVTAYVDEDNPKNDIEVASEKQIPKDGRKIVQTQIYAAPYFNTGLPEKPYQKMSELAKTDDRILLHFLTYERNPYRVIIKHKEKEKNGFLARALSAIGIGGK